MQSVPKHRCSQCLLRDICLPMGVGKEDLERLEQLVQSSKVHHQNDVVIRQNDPFHRLYAVKSGMYKSVRLNSEGEEYVVGFHLPGEIIGLDAIYPEVYISSVIALTNSVLCQLDYEQLVSLSATIPPLHRQLMRLSSKEINIVQVFQCPQTAEQKLAAFIHNLAIRNEVRGYSAT
ncbi:MAG: cyclic nucleotide-binding domain-containing protein, partial [Leucothrix sp.]